MTRRFVHGTLFSCLLCASVALCGDPQAPSISVKHIDPPVLINGGFAYRRPWDSVALGDLSYLARPEFPSECRDFVQALSDVEKGDLDVAVGKLKKLVDSDPLVSRSAGNVLASIFAIQSKWAAISSLPAFSGKESFCRLTDVFAKSVPETVTFRGDVCTLKAVSLFGCGCPWIDVRVNKHPARFLIDTGASFTTITERFARSAGITFVEEKPGRIMASDRGKVAAWGAIIDCLEVGNVVFTSHPCDIVPQKALRIEEKQVDGVIGWNAIRHLDLVIDMTKGMVVIHKPKAKVGVRRTLFWLGAPLVRCQDAAGHSILAGIDTGSGETLGNAATLRLLPREYFKRFLGGIEKGTDHFWGASGETTEKVDVAQRVSIVVGNVLVTQEQMNVERTGGDGPVLKPWIVLGSDIAKYAAMHIDATNGVFELCPTR